MTTARLIDGKASAAKLRADVARQVATLKLLREDAGQKQVPLAGLAGELTLLMAARGGGQE